MKVLIIFDHTINLEELKKKLSMLDTSHISLFPVTSNWQLIGKTEDICRATGGAYATVERIESARLIDSEVDILRDKIVKWSADLGNHNIGNKSLKDWFSLPGNEISTWWFSFISEKNPLKTSAFFRIAQIQAIDRIISQDKYKICILCIYEKEFSLAVKKLNERHSVATLCISPITKGRVILKEQLRWILSACGIWGYIFKAQISLVLHAYRFAMAKFFMDPIKKRLKRIDNSVLFISYFPAIDKENADKGVLINKYSAALQEKLSSMGKNIIWVWMYVFLNDYSYKDAIKLARRFSEHGTMNFFLDEFASFKLFSRVFIKWLRQIRIYTRLRKDIPEDVLYENLSIPEASFFIKKIMKESFVGEIGLEGIFFYEVYKEVFSSFSYVSHCIYHAEMHAWEKALNAAKRLVAPQIKTIGFQHTSISKNFFHYFYHPSEILKGERFNSLPLPDIFACNGDMPLILFEKCRYPNIIKVEALRYLYIEDYLNATEYSKKENVILLAGSIDKEETKALFSIFYEAFPEPELFQVWLKGHPFVPFEKILHELGIRLEDDRYIIKYEAIDRLLKSVRVVLVGSSTVALEALAAGCNVISAVFSDSMFISPLVGFEQYYEKVYNIGGLKNVVKKIVETPERQKSMDAKDFISRCWCLDKSLQRWERLFI